MSYIGCDVLGPEPEPRGRRRHVIDPDQIQRCKDNLQLWYDQAIDARTLAQAERLDLLDEESIKLLLRRP